jgi:hypothetical protein
LRRAGAKALPVRNFLTEAPHGMRLRGFVVLGAENLHAKHVIHALREDAAS